MERTLVIFKPDSVQRRLIGQILQRFEGRGLRLAALKLMRVDRSHAERHYAEHRERAFFNTLLDFLTSSPIVVAILVGPEAVSVVRHMVGPTNGVEAPPGTIRGDFALSRQNNLIHASDGLDSAEREIALWFQPEEIVDYDLAGTHWTFGGTSDDPDSRKGHKTRAK